MSGPPTSVLFVCHANVCRSPLAEGIFRALVTAAGRRDAFTIDSAGTHAIEGAPPHRLSVEVGRRHGIEVSGSARQILRADLQRFDHVLVMDRHNLDELTALAAAFGPLAGHHADVALVRIAAGTATRRDRDVADPIGGDLSAYERTFELLDAAARALLSRWS